MAPNTPATKRMLITADRVEEMRVISISPFLLASRAVPVRGLVNKDLAEFHNGRFARSAMQKCANMNVMYDYVGRFDASRNVRRGPEARCACQGGGTVLSSAA